MAHQQQRMHGDELLAVIEATGSADVLALVVDSSGIVNGIAGGFAPIGLQAGAPLPDILGRGVLTSGLMPALIETITSRSGTSADFVLEGIACHALCYPIEGAPDRCLILITPDYREVHVPVEASVSAQRRCDVRQVMLDVRRRMEETADRGNEVFAWTEDEALEVDIAPETVLRLVDVLLEAPLAIHPYDGTAVLTARRDRARGDAVVLSMRAYGPPTRPSILRALEAIQAEFSAATGIPIEMAEGKSQVNIVATLTTEPGGVVSPSAAGQPRSIARASAV